VFWRRAEFLAPTGNRIQGHPAHNYLKVIQIEAIHKLMKDNFFSQAVRYIFMGW